MSEASGSIIVLVAIIAAIAIIFFHVPPDQVASVSLNVSRVIFILTIIAIVIGFIYIASQSETDRYGIRKPVKDEDKLYHCGFILGIVMAGYGVVLAIIAMIFGKTPFSQAFAFVFSFLLAGIIYTAVICVLLKILYVIAEKTYGMRLENEKQHEIEAHAVCDPLMLEAVERNIPATTDEIKNYCVNKAHLNENRKFLNYDFFFSEALHDFVKTGKLKYLSDSYILPEHYTEAHTIWDPIMLEAVDNGGLVSENQVKEYCRKKGSAKYQDLVKISCFISEGLQEFVKKGKIGLLKTHNQGSNIEKSLYETKNRAKRYEVTEEFSLDD